jgi:ubiquinol-cytochrome c reductase iron-sulfur subunit
MTAERAQTRAIAISFAISTSASVALAIVYLMGGRPQIEGVLLGLSLGGLAIGFVLWGHRLMPQGPFTEDRESLLGHPAERAEAVEDFEAGADTMERRGFLGRMVAVALAALGGAALFPVRSLGSRPGRSLYNTQWTPGARMVTIEDALVRVDTLEVGGFVTVFPEGHAGSADSQVALLRLSPGSYEEAGAGTAPEGYVAFSKICTHAGCPIGLYEPATRSLFCPCHQSVFAVMAGATPTAGPATRPLPQLPIEVDDNGYLVAIDDFSEPVGPGFWGRGR